MSLLQLYEALCERADALLVKHDPCKWNPQEKDCARKSNGCCMGCPYLSLETGCTIQSLACKLWICPEIYQVTPHHIIREFSVIWQTAQEHNLLTFRGDKWESVRNAKFPNANKRRYVMVNMYGQSVWIFKPDRGMSDDEI